MPGGGIKDSQFILGTPEEMRKQVKLLCETVGKGGGYIVSGGCNFPYTAKPENFRAMIDAVCEYGVYDAGTKARPKTPPKGGIEGFSFPRMVTPWHVRQAESGGVMGDEGLIRKPWESLEAMAYVWLWQWVL